MTSPGRARVDLATTTVGFGLVGLSAFVFLAAGPRLLGNDGFSVAAVAWTTVTILGVGIALPGEQAITRAWSQVPPAGGAAVLRRLAVVTALTVLLPLADLAGHPVLGLTGAWAWAVPVAMAGWSLTAGQRGRCAGTGRFNAYSASLLAEAVTRLLLVAAAWLWPGAAGLLLPLAIGVPLLASAAAARVLRGPESGAPAADAPSAEHLSFTGVALLIQLTVNVPVLWLQWRQPDSAGPGVLTAVLTYFRIPLLLVGGVAATTLSAVSRAAAAGDRSEAGRRSREALALAAGGGLVAVGLLAVLSGPLLAVYYGSPVDLPVAQTVVLAAGAAVLIVASVATPVSYAFGLARPALGAWAAGTVVLLAVLAAAPVGVGGAAWALLAGPGTALALLLLLARRAAGRQPTTTG